MQKIAQIITKIIDFFYYPFKNYISQQLFRYAACGGANMVFDWILYFIIYNFVIGHDLIYFQLPTLNSQLSTINSQLSTINSQLSTINCQLSTINYQLCITPHIATLCIVFPITLLTGFWLNKYVTFRQSSLRTHKQLLRYILIVAINLAVNYVGLKLLVDTCGWYPTPSKIFITLITVAISFFGQKYYSFRHS